MRPLLSPEERARAADILTDTARDRFICSRGMLRQLLSRYLDRDGHRIVIAAGVEGKPRLIQSPGRESLAFNLSHSGNYVAIAFASEQRSVGVDIEVARPLELADRLAGDILSHSELSAFNGLRGPQQSQYLLSVWTRKEALLKASGLVRSHSPADLCTGAGPECRNVCLENGGQYIVASYAVEEELYCALALSGAGLQIVDMPGREY